MTRRAERSTDVHLPPQAAPRFTPSAAGAAPRGFTSRMRKAFVPDPALVRRGAWHVRLGTAASVLAVAGMGATAVMVASDARLSRVLVQWSGALVWQLIVAAGILASSRVGRLIALGTGLVALVGSTLLAGLLLLGGPTVTVYRESLLGFTACLGVYAAAIGLATMTTSAQAWHDAQEALHTVKRKAKSLAEWRRGKADSSNPST